MVYFVAGGTLARSFLSEVAVDVVTCSNRDLCH